MLRISDGPDGLPRRTLRLEGHVTGPWVGELRRVCQERLSDGGTDPRLTLDLAGVAFLDADGLALFGELAARHVMFVNPTPFIAEQLKGVGNVRRQGRG